MYIKGGTGILWVSIMLEFEVVATALEVSILMLFMFNYILAEFVLGHVYFKSFVF